MSKVSKASLIREIVAAGYTERSANTLRRWSLESLQDVLQSIQMPRAPISPPDSAQTLPASPGSEEMASYVDACTLAESVSYDMPTIAAGDEVTYVKNDQVYVPTDRELYQAASLQPVSPPIQPSWERFAAMLLAPWTFLLKFAGVA